MYAYSAGQHVGAARGVRRRRSGAVRVEQLELEPRGGLETAATRQRVAAVERAEREAHADDLVVAVREPDRPERHGRAGAAPPASSAAAGTSASRNPAAVSAGRARASRAARTATRAAATAVPATSADAPPGSGATAAPGASRSGFGVPSKAGPREEKGAGPEGVPPPLRACSRLTRPNFTLAPRFASSAAFAAAAVSPTTGAATRPAGISGSGRRRGSASSTARAPAAAAAAAWATGLAPARTSATRPLRRGPLASRASASIESTGPASGVEPAGGVPPSTAAPRSARSPIVTSSARGAGAVLGRARGQRRPRRPR